MTPEDLESIISQGEGLTVEFKEARNTVPRDAFPSFCAFLNRRGGHLILGVKDDGTITGVDESSADAMKRDFASLSNNPTKLEPTFLMELSEVRLGDNLVLHVYVPQSSQVHKCDNSVYDRGHEGDFKVRSHTEISQMYARKSAYYSENHIYSFLNKEAFKPGIIDRVRALIGKNRRDHPWLYLSDEDLLESAGLWQTDYQTGQSGYTLAAALLLGRDEVIRSIMPHYRIDALVRREDLERFDDRVDIRTNLIEAYEQLMAFAEKHLPDPFFTEGDQRTSLREKIFREVVGNLIVHREYTNAIPARFIIYTNRVEVENANKPSAFGPLNPEKFSPFPKNPTIARFFVQLGRVDELGSGIRNITRYLRAYRPGSSAQFLDEDVFRTAIPVPESGVKPVVVIPVEEKPLALVPSEALTKVLQRVKTIPVVEQVQERYMAQIQMLADGLPHTAAEIADTLDYSGRSVRRDLLQLRAAGVVSVNGYYYQIAWLGI